MSYVLVELSHAEFIPDLALPPGRLPSPILRSTMTASATSPSVLDQLVKRAQRLYSLPSVAMRVLDLTNQATIDAKALKCCIENDPALTTKILRVVNSSLFGMSREVTDLNQALALLGTKPLKLLVLGFSLPEELFSGIEGEVLHRYWQHAVIKAVAAREVSELVWDMPGDEAFIGGLLQDIGTLVLIQSLGETYTTFLDSVFHGGGDLAALETSTLGFDHSVLSARLLDHWQLPPTIVSAVGVAHNSERILGLPPDEQVLPQILHLAELIACFLTQRDAEFLAHLLNIGQQYHELTESQLDSLIRSLEEKVPQLAEILSLQLPEGTDYSAILALSHRQLAEVAADAAAGMLPDIHSGEVLLREARELGQEIERFVGQPLGAEVNQNGLEQAVRDQTPEQAVPRQSPLRRHPPPSSATRFMDETGLCGLLGASVSACRQARTAISLAYVELDEFEAAVMLGGMAATEQAVDVLGRSIAGMLGEDGDCVQIADARFAAILRGYEREAAVEAARDLLTAVRKWSLDNARRGRNAVSISVGLATLSMPPKNFPPRELIDAAVRCLDGVQLSGGDGLKSREVY